MENKKQIKLNKELDELMIARGLKKVCAVCGNKINKDEDYREIESPKGGTILVCDLCAWS